jgi:exodeoxyribonuclease VII small subunit
MNKKTQITYTNALAEIEEIIAGIEANSFSIDELSDKVKRVSFLIKFCKDKLRDTEEEVNSVLKHIEG